MRGRATLYDGRLADRECSVCGSAADQHDADDQEPDQRGEVRDDRGPPPPAL